jgi:hypothetical protein
MKKIGNKDSPKADAINPPPGTAENDSAKTNSPSIAEDKDSSKADATNPLLRVLDKSITAVPAVKYALGIAGVAAAAALVLTFFKSIPTAILGIAFLLVAMILLRVFARLAASSGGELRVIALVFAWCFVVLFCGFGLLTTTCVFFDKPKPYPVLVKTLINPTGVLTEEKTHAESEHPTAQSDLTISQLTKLSNLPLAMRTPVPGGLSEEDFRERLRTKGSLTVDGTLLVVGDIGDGSSATLSVSSLHLVNGARIVTNGNTLNIQADLIDSSGGEIVSFYPPDNAPADAAPGSPGIKGADGGTLHISALQDLSAPLKVDLRGENGGRGGAGMPGAAGPPGVRGQSGVDHLFDCASGGTNGTAGGPGEQGKAGGVGGDGGAGGTLFLSRNLTLTKVDFSAHGGIGGLGGPGGNGGPGGPGGEGGSGSLHCGGGRGGPNGADGLPGNAGRPGQAGQANAEILRF